MVKKALVSFIFLIVMTDVVSAASPDPLISFDQALEEMTDNHSTVLIQKTKLNSSEIGVSASQYNFLPTVSLNASQQAAVPTTPATNSISATANVNLFRAGADFAGIRAANRDKDAQFYSLDFTVLTAEDESAQALINQISKQRQIEILNRNVQTFQVGLSIARLRYQKGLLPLQEVDKVSVDFDNAEARLSDAREDANTAEANLVRLLGSHRVETLWPWRNRLKNKAIQYLLSSEIPIELRPDYKAALSTVQAETERKSQAYRAQYPALNLSASTGNSQYLGQPFSGAYTSLGISMPIFNGLKDNVQYQLQQEALSAAEIKFRQTVRDIQNISKSSQKNLEVALSTAFSREKTLETSQRLYKSNELRMKQGRANANELAVDQQRLTDSELLALQGWATAHLAFVRLCHAFGRRVNHCETN